MPKPAPEPASNYATASLRRSVRQRGATLRHALEYWTPERLARLGELCARRASWDDFNAVFNGVGQAKIMIGLREIIARKCEDEAR